VFAAIALSSLLRTSWTHRSAGAAVVLCIALFPAASHAQVYVGDAVAGESVVLSNFRSLDAPQLLIAAPRISVEPAVSGLVESSSSQSMPANRLQLPPSSPELRRVIDEVAAKVGISADLLHAVIATESRYNSRALSPRGAIGLMQLLPATAKRFGAQDPYAPQENVLAGAQYLKWLMVMFQDDLELVLAAYNAGEQAVLKAGGRIPPYAETRAYVPRVLAYLRCATAGSCKLT
jgi:soluble lytic murein transglycosylase-like protein